MSVNKIGSLSAAIYEANRYTPDEDKLVKIEAHTILSN